MNNIKAYFDQIKLEIKKTLGSKLMIIFIGLLIIMSIAAPILSTLDLFNNNGYYYSNYGVIELDIDGIAIEEDNIFYWQIQNLTEMKSWVQESATTSNDDLTIELLDTLLNDYKEISTKGIESHNDYRANVVWSRREYIATIFILEHLDIPADEMQEILQKSDTYYKETSTLKTEYYEISDEEKQEKLKDAEEALELSDKIILYGDHQAYFDYMLKQAESNNENSQSEIERLEQEIIENPENEEIFNEQIESYRQEIENNNTISIPILEYRMANDIVPGADDWRDTAISAKESALYSVEHYSDIKTQEEFENEQYMRMQYGTYDTYKKAMEQEIEEYTNKLQVAEKSLENDKPDMEYVPDGSRSKVTDFLWYSLLIAVFAAIFAGALMAREFQTGTIRLLFIRPRSRAKIALSKFFSLIIICIVVYSVCVILNLITNGFLFGFSDLGYPNYTISSGVSGIGFFGYIVPKILACFLVVIFGASVAYFLSIVTRNTALSVSIPLVCFAGSLIAMSIIGYSEKYKWIIYTPLPYVNMPQILTNSYYSPHGIEPIISYGIGLLLGLSVIAVVVGTLILRKRDITN